MLEDLDSKVLAKVTELGKPVYCGELTEPLGFSPRRFSIVRGALMRLEKQGRLISYVVYQYDRPSHFGRRYYQVKV